MKTTTEQVRRNNQMADHMARLMKKFTPLTAWSKARDINASECKPPLSLAELHRIYLIAACDANDPTPIKASK